jgi:CBS domain-containing protein
MTVSELMSGNVQTVAPTMTIVAARTLMRAKRIHHLVVVKGADLVGVVSARDLSRRSPGRTSKAAVVADVMSRHVLMIDRDATMARASHTMRGHSVGCLVVLDRGRVAGIVTTSDLLGLLGRSTEWRRPRAEKKTAIHHRVGHRHRSRGDGTW